MKKLMILFALIMGVVSVKAQVTICIRALLKSCLTVKW